METQAGNALPGWRATCAVAIVAATLLASCERESLPNGVHAHANTPLDRARASDLYVDMDEGVVTVRAREAPLHAVIEKLAKHGGLRLTMQDRLDERVTVELHSPTLTAALQELLRGRSFILMGTSQIADTPQDSKGTLWIFAANGQNGSGANVATDSADESALPEEPRSLGELSAAIVDHDWNARLDAVSELGSYLDDEQAAMMLASVASRDEHPSVRIEALHAIADGRADTHAPVFTRALTDRDADVRKAAISALENVGTERSLQTLAIALKDHDASVRATAVDAIGEIGGEAARRLLESALADESADVREAAFEQLAPPASPRTEGGQ